ncbi:hypothetical protein T09_13374 [Trichinella sp. T9]|nr:hypothetical protein T09_6541 [Trichinella sp. T9]KRX60617.1 hypothetical protein T09_13374 [Trichinella sp. T9]
MTTLYRSRTTALVDVTKIAQKHSAHNSNTGDRIDADDDNRVSIELLASTEEIWSVTINKKQQVDLIKSDNTWWAAKQITSNRETSIIRKLNIVITAPECIASIMMEILSKNKCTPNASASSKTRSTKVDNISQFLWNRWNAKIDDQKTNSINGLVSDIQPTKRIFGSNS